MLMNNSVVGAFEFEESIAQDPTRANWVRYIAHDLNADGWRDVISHSPWEIANLSIMRNMRSSQISLELPAIVLSGTSAAGVQPGDINGDGKVDLVVGTSSREFSILASRTNPNGDFSFEKIGTFGLPTPSDGSRVDPHMTISDLNGDGRPEIINAYDYYYGPHDGYQFEIWQNSPSDCIDPSLVRISASSNSATIVLPPNTTMDNFEIAYAEAGSSYWTRAWSESFYIQVGSSYQLRVRAKCYLGFTDYYYINFETDCVDVSSFSISVVDTDRAYLFAYNLSSLEIEYSRASENVWIPVEQYSNQITNLLPGTTYEVRYRGRWCAKTPDFKYKEFTTICPTLSTLTVVQLMSNQAEVRWTSNKPGNAILEYSSDNVNWTSIDESLKMFPLIPGTMYFVRGKMKCNDVEGEYFSVQFMTPCPVVSSLFVNEVTPFSAKINWTDELATGNYYVTHNINGTPVSIETSSTSYILEGLNPGTQYSIAVAPVCNSSGTFTSATFNTVCYVPVDLLVSDITYTEAELSWKDNFGVLPYSVDYSIYGSNYWVTKEITSPNLSLSGLRPGTKYEVRVHINCTSVTAPYASSVFETELYDETTFAPNPTDGKVTIRPSKNLIGKHFTIMDNTGRLLFSGELRDYTIDLSNFSAGIHILKIDGENL
jgi:hypothetical protein